MPVSRSERAALALIQGAAASPAGDTVLRTLLVNTGTLVCFTGRKFCQNQENSRSVSYRNNNRCVGLRAVGHR